MGKVIALLFLIAIIAGAGLVWFDYLNVIDAKSVLAPIYKHLPFVPGDGRSQPAADPDALINLDAERLAVRLEALELVKMEADVRERDLDSRYGEIEQIASELEEQRKAVEDQQKSLIADAAAADNKDSNVERNARNLNGMPPASAVKIMAEMPDQDVIDILWKTEAIAQAEGTTSIVSYWLSLMEPARAAELQRKMVSRPQTL